MHLRLWAIWEPADLTTPRGYHLEVDRPYARVPTIGESIDLPASRFGLSHPVIEGVNWDDDGPNLNLGSFEEGGGAKLGALTEAGFHTTDEQRPSCRYCTRHLGGRGRRYG